MTGSNATGTSSAENNGGTARVFESQCTADQLQSFYTQALSQNQWTGSFFTGSANGTAGATGSGTTTSSSTGASAAASPVASAGASAGPSDSTSNMPIAGTFLSASSSGEAVVFLDIRPAQSTATGASAPASGGAMSYVEMIEQQIPLNCSVAGVEISSSGGTTSSGSVAPCTGVSSTGTTSGSGSSATSGGASSSPATGTTGASTAGTTGASTAGTTGASTAGTTSASTAGTGTSSTSSAGSYGTSASAQPSA